MNAQNFNVALETFINDINDGLKEYQKEYKHLTAGAVTKSVGTRYIKLYVGGPEYPVYCFIDPTNGDILKAAGRASPAKGARGNIFDRNSYPKGLELGATAWHYVPELLN